MRIEGALPTSKLTRHDGSDGPVLWWASAAPRVGDMMGLNRVAVHRVSVRKVAGGPAGAAGWLREEQHFTMATATAQHVANVHLYTLRIESGVLVHSQNRK